MKHALDYKKALSYKGYVILNLGYGYSIYKKGKIETWFSKISQCYDWIDEQVEKQKGEI